MCVCACNNNDMVAWSSQLLINEVGQRREFQSMAISFESNIFGVRVHHRKPCFVSVFMVVQQLSHSWLVVRCIYQGGLSSTANHISFNSNEHPSCPEYRQGPDSSMGRTNAKMSMCADLMGQKETCAAFHLKSPRYFHERSQVPCEFTKVLEREPYLCCWTASVLAPWEQLLRLVELQKRVFMLTLSLSPLAFHKTV